MAKKDHKERFPNYKYEPKRYKSEFRIVKNAIPEDPDDPIEQQSMNDIESMNDNIAYQQQITFNTFNEVLNITDGSFIPPMENDYNQNECYWDLIPPIPSSPTYSTSSNVSLDYALVENEFFNFYSGNCELQFLTNRNYPFYVDINYES